MNATYRRLALDLEMYADLDRMRDGVVKLLANTPEGAKGRKALIRVHAQGERLRRELFGCWYAEPLPDAPLIKEGPHAVNVP